MTWRQRWTEESMFIQNWLKSLKHKSKMAVIIINPRQLTVSLAITFSQKLYNYVRILFEWQIIFDCMQIRIIMAYYLLQQRCGVLYARIKLNKAVYSNYGYFYKHKYYVLQLLCLNIKTLLVASFVVYILKGFLD